MSAPISENALPRASLWHVVVSSFKGETRDYTTETLHRAVLFLAVPMVLEMAMESVFALADVFWVSRLGSDAVAVVGLTESIMTIIYAVAIGLAMAGAAIVARRVGERDNEEAARSGVQVILLGLFVALGLGLIGIFFGPSLLRHMGANDAVLRIGSTFSRIMIGGNVTVTLIFLINAIFRGAGDAAFAMRTLILANSLNIILGPCLIFGLGLGVTGAAIATNIGRGCGVLYQLYHLTRRPGRIQIARRHFVFEPDVIGSIIRVGSTGIFQNLIGMTSWIGLVRILSQFGSSALAGYTIAIRLVIFAILPAWGLSNAGATLVGQNLGAKRPDRAESAVWIAVRYNVIFLGIIGAFFIALSAPITWLFTQEPEVHRYATLALWVIALGFPFYAAGMCMTSAFNGAGDTWTPTRLNIACFWLFEIPFAWCLAEKFSKGPAGVFIAITIAFSLLALAGLVVFRRGGWKTVKV
jgi:putative MATE family efflux protein